MRKSDVSLIEVKGKSMTDKRILRRIIVRRPMDEVVLELVQEGWPIIADNGDQAFLYKDRVVIARAVKAENN